jgi:hypothetical protein
MQSVGNGNKNRLEGIVAQKLARFRIRRGDTVAAGKQLRQVSIGITDCDEFNSLSFCQRGEMSVLSDSPASDKADTQSASQVDA